jgi:flagellar hook protein FlgE
MGIFGALTTAVSGLRAQSYALENISGNIANSQTTAFKRTDTSFTDLIPDNVPSRQVAGAVISQSRATNTLQGDIQAASSATYMALNGDGYFIVANQTGTVDGAPVFGGTDMYTRRGDFEVNKDGFLVNGAGYYLKLLPIDRATGNVSGSVPEVMPLTNDILPARATTAIQYRGNLPLSPRTEAADSTIPGSDLLDPTSFTGDPRTATTTLTPFTTTGAVMTAPGALVTGGTGAGYIADNNTLDITVDGGTTVTMTFGTDPGEFDSLTALRDFINNSADLNGVTADIVGTNQLRLTGDGQNNNIVIAGSARTELGLPTTANPTLGASTGSIRADEESLFLEQSINGEALTIYDSAGTPLNVQLRWAKVNSEQTGGTDTWNLFYMTDSNAAGADPKWLNVGQDFVFQDSVLNPPFASTTISNLTVNGVNAGNIQLVHGSTGLTQFSEASGQANIITLNQDGYSAGEVVRVQIADGGRITAFYSNGQMADIAEIPTVYFNADNSLKRVDGGAFATTFESGPPIPGAPATIIGSSLEGSNTDIADEFTKLIVTQQAYSANTRIVSTADEMLQEALNMVR